MSAGELITIAICVWLVCVVLGLWIIAHYAYSYTDEPEETYKDEYPCHGSE